MELIVIDTVRQHLENGMRLHASCRCGRGEYLDLARLIELGFGDVRAAELGERLRCRKCGRKGRDVQSARTAALKLPLGVADEVEAHEAVALASDFVFDLRRSNHLAANEARFHEAVTAHDVLRQHHRHAAFVDRFTRTRTDFRLLEGLVLA